MPRGVVLGAAMLLATCGRITTPEPPAEYVGAKTSAPPCSHEAPTETPVAGVADAAAAQGAATVKLAEGRASRLPNSIIARVIIVPQQPGDSVTQSHQAAGFLYLGAGRGRIAPEGGVAIDLQSGQALFLDVDVVHTQSNAGSDCAEWYWVVYGNPTTQDLLRLGYPSGRWPFQQRTPQVGPGSYDQALYIVTLQVDGRTAARRNGGLESIFVLDGQIEVRSPGPAPEVLDTEQGTLVLPGTAVQVRNVGATPARFLSFFLTAEGQAFRTLVDTPP